MERKEFEIDILCDYSVKEIERAIIQEYNNTRCYDSDYGVLLSLRKNIINKEMLAHQKELLPDIISFNDALCEALHDMYNRAHRIWDKMIENVLTLTFPRDEDESFDSFIGMDCPPPNWNEGLDQELTKDLHLISQFHKLFQHMNFALTDFIYVRKFKTEINIEINSYKKV